MTKTLINKVKLAGIGDIMAAKKGDKVKIEYTGTLEDGSVFDSTEKHGKPLEFELGSGMVIPGFDSAIMGMEVGEEKDIKLQPKDAYGDPNDQLIREEPKERFPTEQELKEGMMLLVALPNGQQMPVKIVKVTDKNVTVDFNHPLAGKVLNFKLKLVE